MQVTDFALSVPHPKFAPKFYVLPIPGRTSTEGCNHAVRARDNPVCYPDKRSAMGMAMGPRRHARRIPDRPRQRHLGRGTRRFSCEALI